jgi:hypothetical protein
VAKTKGKLSAVQRSSCVRKSVEKLLTVVSMNARRFVMKGLANHAKKFHQELSIVLVEERK